MDVLEKIEKLRTERGWSKNYLAMEAMLTQSTLNNLYVRKAEPKLSTLRAICDAFGITLAEFFSDEGHSRSDSDRTDREISKQVARLDEREKQALLTILRSMK